MEPFYQKRTFRLGMLVVLVFSSCLLSFMGEIYNTFYFFFQVYASSMSPDFVPPEFNAGVAREMLIVVVAFALFALFFVATLFMASQFVLPVDRFENRGKVFSRLWDYVIGMHGPAIFVKGGVQTASPEELNRPGYGVVLADLASAVVIEKRGGRHYTAQREEADVEAPGKKGKRKPKVRVEGPGIIFLENNEQVRDTFDLRPQFRIRLDARAYTSEGLEFSAHIITRFTLGEPPVVLDVAYVGDPVAENIQVISKRSELINSGSGKTERLEFFASFKDELDDADKEEIHRFVQAYAYRQPAPPAQNGKHTPVVVSPFEFDRERIFSAVFAKALEPGTNKIRDWDMLPGDVGVQTFRDLLNKISYDQLYQFDVDNPEAKLNPDPEKQRNFSYNLPKIKGQFSTRMRNQGILAFRFVARQDGSPLQPNDLWDENLLSVLPVQQLQNPKPLRRYGIKLNFASFSVLRPVTPIVRQQLAEHWRGSWQKKALEEGSEYDRLAARHRAKARARAQFQTSKVLAEIFAQHANSENALTLQLYLALEKLAADAETRALLPSETLNMLNNLRYWIAPMSKPIYPGLEDGAVPSTNQIAPSSGAPHPGYPQGPDEHGFNPTPEPEDKPSKTS